MYPLPPFAQGTPQTLLIVKTGGLVDTTDILSVEVRDGAEHVEQESPLQKRTIQPKMSTVPKLGDPVVVERDHSIVSDDYQC